MEKLRLHLTETQHRVSIQMLNYTLRCIMKLK